MRCILLAFLCLFSGVVLASQQSYQQEIIDWQSKRQKSIKNPKGWLSLTGLFWLHEGVNSFGSAGDNEIQLPKGRDYAGNIILKKNGIIEAHILPGSEITVDGKVVSKVALLTDQEQNTSHIQSGSVDFYLIQRGEKIAARVKDFNRVATLDLEPLSFYPININWKIKATYHPYPKGTQVHIPTVIDTTFTPEHVGKITFQVHGKQYSLDAIDDGKYLFVIFKDKTSQTKSYGAGRFLYAPKPSAKDTTFWLDFNKAYNPPCAFSSYATCPLPPPQNQLELAIHAGEQRYQHYD
ncbi:DUF1684 domain-containing protein [Algicola sagamiensis]|uniref:DUF1684 domain-containing protein n=1 Tax=Algicola sagamiensis TaxID=163869 RepID=UPI000370BACC|nr:DUF1684 domain-containing protein [Algicola sagamiensis]